MKPQGPARTDSRNKMEHVFTVNQNLNMLKWFD